MHFVLNRIARETDQERCKPETFRIVRLEANQWRLTYNNADHTFNSLAEVAHFIKADTNERVRLPPSKYDRPPLLLLLLPKNLKAKKTDLQLSESELQRRNPQIFNPKTDLQWYPGGCFVQIGPSSTSSHTPAPFQT